MNSARHLRVLTTRSISSTPHLSSIYDKIKSGSKSILDKISGNPQTDDSVKPKPQVVASVNAKPQVQAPEKPKPSVLGGIFKSKSKTEESFTLIEFANQMDKAGLLGKLGGKEVTDTMTKTAEILRYLGAIDPTGKNLQSSHKQAATKDCKCTIAEVEHILAKFMWAKEAQIKMEKMKEEGKPIPTSFKEVQKMMGSNPVDVGNSNLAKTGQISRNSLCPCGSKKRYKRCCGDDTAKGKTKA